MSTPDEGKGAPSGVHPMSYADAEHLGVDEKGGLYWNGVRLSLTPGQTALATLVSIAVILGSLGALAQGIDAGHDFGCKLHWWTTGCAGR
jgi:hypothetical protein